MQTTANITRLITGNSSRSGFADLKSLISAKEILPKLVLNGLYQIENSKQAFNALTNKLISIAEYFYARRNAAELEEVSQVLINLPLSEAHQIGLYYQALAKYRRGERAEAHAQAEKTSDSAPLLFRARSLQSLGGFCYSEGRFDDALRFNRETLRIVSSSGDQNPLVSLMMNLNNSYILSAFGDNQGALSKLESLWPLVRAVAKENPLHFYAYHNSLAVELAEVGRFDEAQAASDIAMSASFASAYPEWAETREEIAQKRDSKWSNLPASPEPLLATELNSDSNRDSQTAADSKIETEAVPQAQQVRAVKYRRAVTSYFLIPKYNFQIPSDGISARSAAVNLKYAQSILERLGESIRPRSPPCFS
jgi:tetratricopeptide (TPR) repeat protein